MIELRRICKSYNPHSMGAVKALNNIDLKIDSGELVAVVGKSGAGKSTLLHVVSCIDDFDTGELIFEEESIEKKTSSEITKFRIKNIGLVLQNFALIDEFSVFENVSLPLKFKSKTFLQYRKNKKTITDALQMVGINDLAKRKVYSLSGGQKQRVAIARAIVNNPKVILADEPTGALDSKTSKEIIGVLKELNKNGTTVIIVTHDIDVSKQCRRIIELSDGKIISDIYQN